MPFKKVIKYDKQFQFITGSWAKTHTTMTEEFLQGFTHGSSKNNKTQHTKCLNFNKFKDILNKSPRICMLQM